MRRGRPQIPGATPTLADVARHAGVSTATVSRYMNSPQQVVEATRNRVETSIKELGYSPNFGARALVAKRTNTIGAIIPTMENAIFARGLQAFQEELRQNGMTLLVSSSSYREDLEEEQIRTLTARGADGLLLIGHHRDPDLYKFLEKQGVPVLVAWVYDPDQPQTSIGFDNKAAMKSLAVKAIELGHRKIGVIGAEIASNDRARDRVNGVAEAMSDAGLSPNHMTMIETPYSIDAGADAFGMLMKGNEPPSIVMCGNDVLAVGALRQAKDMGLNVPGDVSVTGFDDIELAKVASPALTTVHVPHRNMGRTAARMLVRMVGGWTPEKSVLLPTELRIRETLGAVSS